MFLSYYLDLIFFISNHELWNEMYPLYLSESPLGSSKDVQPVSQANHERIGMS